MSTEQSPSPPDPQALKAALEIIRAFVIPDLQMAERPSVMVKFEKNQWVLTGTFKGKPAVEICLPAICEPSKKTQEGSFEGFEKAVKAYLQSCREG